MWLGRDNKHSQKVFVPTDRRTNAMERPTNRATHEKQMLTESRKNHLNFWEKWRNFDESWKKEGGNQSKTHQEAKLEKEEKKIRKRKLRRQESNWRRVTISLRTGTGQDLTNFFASYKRGFFYQLLPTNEFFTALEIVCVISWCGKL